MPASADCLTLPSKRSLKFSVCFVCTLISQLTSSSRETDLVIRFGNTRQTTIICMTCLFILFSLRLDYLCIETYLKLMYIEKKKWNVFYFLCVVSKNEKKKYRLNINNNHNPSVLAQSSFGAIWINNTCSILFCQGVEFYILI